MTLQETATIMDILTAAYPHFYGGKNAPNVKSTLSLWASVFADDDVRLVAAAVKAIIVADTREFPPTIAHVKEKMRQLVAEKDELTEAEAWTLISHATRNGLYGSKEEYAKLPPTLQRLVGSPEQLRTWAMMDSDTLHSVVSSNFQRSYKIMVQREREEAKLPKDVLALVSGMSERMMLGTGDK